MMTVPVRVVAPQEAVVDLSDLKIHLRVDGDAEDLLIAAYERAAVSHLDGYRGILGRCILSQQWEVTYSQAGLYRLPLPDVTHVTASAGTATLTHDCLGSMVCLTEGATITLTAALPEDALDTVRQAIRLLVAHWYANREAVVTGTTSGELPLAVAMLIGPIRRVTM